MGKEYVPEYANGEILVCYLDHPENDRDFAKVFGSRILGYKLKGEWKHGDSVFIYETIIGKEEEVCQRFRKQKKFVDWAERRDLKQERLWGSLELAIRKLESIRDSISEGSKAGDKLTEVRNYLNEIIKKEF